MLLNKATPSRRYAQNIKLGNDPLLFEILQVYYSLYSAWKGNMGILFRLQQRHQSSVLWHSSDTSTVLAF